MTTYADKTLTCKECGQEFAFTAREQEFYAQKGFLHAPGRCPACRSARKARQENGTLGARTSGGYSSWIASGSEYRSGRQREYHTATCSSCGKEARVPFVPRGDKPVYCSDCYRTLQSYR